MCRLAHELGVTAGARCVDIRCTSKVLSRPLDLAIPIVGWIDHRKRCHRRSNSGMHRWWLHHLETWSSAVHNITGLKHVLSRTELFCCSGLFRFRCAWSFFSGSVFFGEALLPSFRFPIVVSHSPALLYNPATELTKHGSCCDDSYLAGPVCIRQYILLDKVVFLVLRRNDFV